MWQVPFAETRVDKWLNDYSAILTWPDKESMCQRSPLGNASAQMVKERWKKVTKDLNKDLISPAEDPEMFEEAAPLLFWVSFEEKMKDHLEGLKCLRQLMAPKSGYRSDKFWRVLPPVSTSGRWQQLPRKRQTKIPPLPPPKRWKRDTNFALLW